MIYHEEVMYKDLALIAHNRTNLLTLGEEVNEIIVIDTQGSQGCDNNCASYIQGE